MGKDDKMARLLAKYGVQDLSDPEDQKSVERIATEMAGTGMMETGMKLSLGFGEKTSALLTVYYLRTIMEQNWIMIRQLDRIARSLEE